MDCKETILGIELGSTRIKAVLIDKDHHILAEGSHNWENSFVDGIWTYSLEEVKEGLRSCYRQLKEEVKEKYGIVLKETGAIGISAMMHGYLPFDENDHQICEFRTWRNTMTKQAAEELSRLFDFNIPQRWSVAHLYQAILNKEDHLKDLSYITTLAGYVHYILSGEKVMGIGEASGMFPIDPETKYYDLKMAEKFNALVKEKGYDFDILKLLPEVLVAGEEAGSLSEKGALFLDPSGDLKAGILLCPCEGDAGTGMAATNSVRLHTGNVSAGTSDFAMVVIDKMPKPHSQIDIVTTPAGLLVAMVHCNNCTSDINAWVRLFEENLNLFGVKADTDTLYTKLFEIALDGEVDCGGLLSYNYYSGEGVTDLDEGRPLFIRRADSHFTLANFMADRLYSALATLKIGMDILCKEEKIRIDKLYAHGGFFKTPEVGQRILSAAVAAKVSVMETAAQGGPYGMALLGAYMLWKKEGQSLEDYLEEKVFDNVKTVTIEADQKQIEGFNRYAERYQKALAVERKAVEVF